MIKGLYAAASGMVAQQSRIDTVANNLANISTSGFKRTIPVYKGFYELLVKNVTRSTLSPDSVPGGGIAIDGTFTDHGQGIRPFCHHRECHLPRVCLDLGLGDPGHGPQGDIRGV